MKNVSLEHSYSKAVVKLFMGFEGRENFVGSGVLVSIDHAVVLVTAAHNLTGKNKAGQYLDKKYHSLPNHVRISGHHLNIDVPLHEGDNQPLVDEPLFIADQAADVAILRLPNVSGLTARTTYALHESFLDPEKHSQLSLSVGDFCFLIGYPRGQAVETPDGLSPIWKLATIASEPIHAGRNTPLLLDTWGEKAMSGSPVLVKGEVAGKKQNRFVGVYTGRRLHQVIPPIEDVPSNIAHRLLALELEAYATLGEVTPAEVIIQILKENHRRILRMRLP